MKTEKIDKTDEILVSVYARIYGWQCAAVRPGDRDGAAEVVEAYRDSGAIPFHATEGTRREREALLRQLSSDGLLTVSGNTQARKVGLAWGGVCRAVALTVEREEIPKAFDIMRRVASLAKEAGGPDVSPSGSVPEYLLAPELGQWWADCAPGKESMKLARSKLFCEALPALAMRWLAVAADCHGRKWYSLTATGRETLEALPAIPRGLPDASLTDYYLEESDAAWDVACAAKPRDINAVHVGVPASRWWTAKEGEA